MDLNFAFDMDENALIAYEQYLQTEKVNSKHQYGNLVRRYKQVVKWAFTGLYLIIGLIALVFILRTTDTEKELFITNLTKGYMEDYHMEVLIAFISSIIVPWTIRFIWIILVLGVLVIIIRVIHILLEKYYSDQLAYYRGLSDFTENGQFDLESARDLMETMDYGNHEWIYITGIFVISTMIFILSMLYTILNDITYNPLLLVSMVVMVITCTYLTLHKTSVQQYDNMQLFIDRFEQRIRKIIVNEKNTEEQTNEPV